MTARGAKFAPQMGDKLDFDFDGYVSTPPVWRTVMPLTEFTLEHRREIEWLAQQPEPPNKWWGQPGLFRMETRAWYEWHWHRGIDPDRRREPLSQWVRDQVIERDGYLCGLCGGDVEVGDVHIDHIHPRSKGGSDHLDNLQVAHSSCNLRKGANQDWRP